jgi:hypothetical protein
MIDPITQYMLEQEKDNEKYSKGLDIVFEVIHSVELTDKGLLIGATVAAVVGRMAYKLYKDKLSSIGKQCAQYQHGSSERHKCESNAKKKAMQAQIQVMKAGMSKCAKTKDPDKCKNAIQTKIAKTQAKMQSM